MAETREAMGALFDAAALEALEEDLEIEEELMTEVVDAAGYLIKTHKAQAIPMFDTVFGPLFGRLLKDAKVPETLLINAICVFDDAVEHLGPGAHKYLPTCLPSMLAGVTSESPYVRQAAIYGVGLVAEHAKVQFQNVCGQALQKLVAVASHPQARDEDNLCATENAVGAIGKVCAHYGSRSDVPADKLLPLWLSHLPLREDMIEAFVVHAQLCSMVEAKNTLLLGSDNGRLPQVLKVLCEVLADELADKATIGRIQKLVQPIKSALSPQVLQTVVQQLEGKTQKKAKQLLGV